VSYGVDHHRTAVRLLENRLAADLAQLQVVKREIKEARARGDTTTKYANKRRSISRSVVRTRKDLARMQDTLYKREGWANGS